MEKFKNKKIESLGVNKMERIVKKLPFRHLNYGSSSTSSKSHQSESTVHIINKEDFKSFVQRTTGSPNHPPNIPLNNIPIPNTTRLQKFRPPPLSLVRPTFPIPTPVSISFAIPAPIPISIAPEASTLEIIDFPRLADSFKEPSATPSPFHPNTIAPQPNNTITPNTIAPQPITVALRCDMSSGNMVESPISAFVRQLLESPNSNGDQLQLQPQPQPQQVVSNSQPQHPQIHPHHHSSNVFAPLVSENVTINNPIGFVNASNSLPFDPNETIIKSLMPLNVSNGSSQLEPNGTPIAHSSPTDFMNIPFPSPQSPCGPLFPTNIQLPSPPSPPLFPSNFEFPSPQSLYGPLLSPNIPPPFSPLMFF